MCGDDGGTWSTAPCQAGCPWGGTGAVARMNPIVQGERVREGGWGLAMREVMSCGRLVRFVLGKNIIIRSHGWVC
jgi:hypothetical protein